MLTQSSRRVTVRALLLGDRIDTTGLERPDVLSTTPLCFRVEEGAFVVLFRFGVALLVGMTPLQEDEIIRSLGERIVGRYSRPELESAQIEIAPDKDEQIEKHIGNALLVQQRVSGLVAVAEKPDVLWERPDLERFYARLEDEYELKERADLLTRKLGVISDTGKVPADIIDTERSLRLEQMIIALLLVGIIFAGYQIILH